MAHITLKTLSIPLLIIIGTHYSTLSIANIFHKESKGQGIWTVGITGGYDTQSDNLGIADTLVPSLNMGNGDGPPFIDTQPEQSLIWGVELGYVFPSHFYDIQGSFNRLYSDKTEQVLDTAGMLPIQRKSDLSYNYNEAELTLGNYFKLHSRFMMRFGYGLEYVSIEQKSTDHYNKAEIEETQHSKNEFWGIGPKFTLDNIFTINHQLAFVGRAGLSLLFGQAESAASSVYDPVIGNNGSLIGGDLEQTRAAFGFDGELGIRWHQLCNDMSFNIEVGYQGSTYLNALQEEPVTIADQTAFTTNFGPQENYYNYGPYLTLGVDFF